MAMDTCRIPPEWKQPVMNFRDAVTPEQGQEALESIADLAATENGQELLAQLGPLTEVLTANPRRTLEAIAAVIEGKATESAARLDHTLERPEQSLLGRPVPSAIVGSLSRILDLAQSRPGQARELLMRALKWI
ncbi:MAG: hypothetical protein WBG38_16575 [Nodosilinea sp.]